MAAKGQKKPQLSSKERKDFVMKMELADLPKHYKAKAQILLKEETPPDNKGQGYVVAGAISAFTEGVKGSAKQDILNATLLAQLAANKKYNRETQTEDWYHFYLATLEKIGFVVQAFDFEKYKASGSSFTMDAVVLDVLAAIATGGQSLIISATLTAFKALSNSDSRVVLFEDNSSSQEKGNFQIYPCTQTEDGTVSIALGCFYFNTEQRSTGFLFWNFSSSDTEIYKGGTSLVYNEQVYSSVRSAVISKLGDKAQQLVAEIDI